MAAMKKSACDVIRQRGQFSWIPTKPIKKYTEAMEKMLTEVKEHPKVLINEKYFFSTKIIRPQWSRNMQCQRIGGHLFCSDRKLTRRDNV